MGEFQGKTLATTTLAWQMVDFLGRDFPSEINHNLVVKLNTSCVQNVVTTERSGLGQARLGTDVEDFFPLEQVTLTPTWMRSMALLHGFIFYQLTLISQK